MLGDSEEIYEGVKFKTKFVGRETDAAEGQTNEISETCGKLAKEGLAERSTGNVSVRLRGGGMLITASGASLGKLRREDFVQVLKYDERENELTVKGLAKPSSESIMHLLIYKNFPMTSAIIHVHDRSVLEDPAIAKRMGLKYTKQRYPYGTIELAREVVDALKFSDYAILLHHGSVAIGRKLQDIAERVVEVHRKAVNPMDTLKGL